MRGPYTKLISSWVRESEYLFVHRSGARIERRGYPSTPGWYLVPQAGQEHHHRFEPTPQGCDDAFIAFAASEAGT